MTIGGYDKKNTNVNIVLDLPGHEATGPNIHDVSRYRNHGAITNATWTQLASGLWCLDFDGADDVVDCGSDVSLDNLGTVAPYTFALEAWINPNSLGESSLGAVIYKQQIAFRMASANRFLFGVNDAGGFETAINYDALITYGAWHHIIGAFDGVNILVCADNIWTVGDAAMGPINDHSATPLTVGDWAASTRCFDGMIALPRAYSTLPANYVELFRQRFEETRHWFGV